MDPEDARMRSRQHYIHLMIAAQEVKRVIRDFPNRHVDMLDETRKGLEAYLAALEQEMRECEIPIEEVHMNTFTCKRCGRESDGGVYLTLSAGYGSRFDTIGEEKRGPICDACMMDMIPNRVNHIWLFNRGGSMDMEECEKHVTEGDWDYSHFMGNYMKAVDLLREMAKDSTYAERANEVLKTLKEPQEPGQKPDEESS